MWIIPKYLFSDCLWKTLIIVGYELDNPYKQESYGIDTAIVWSVESVKSLTAGNLHGKRQERYCFTLKDSAADDEWTMNINSNWNEKISICLKLNKKHWNK